MFWVLVETGVDELLEGPAEVALQLWGGALRDQKQGSHRVQLGEGRLAHGQLDSCDAQRPDISLENSTSDSVVVSCINYCYIVCTINYG